MSDIDRDLILSELGQIDASAEAVRLAWPDAPADQLAMIAEGAAGLREALAPPPLPEEVVIEAGQELILDRPVTLKKIHVKGEDKAAGLPRGRLVCNPGCHVTWRDVPVYGDDHEFPGLLVEGEFVVNGDPAPPSRDNPARSVVFESENPGGTRFAVRWAHHSVFQVTGLLCLDGTRTRVDPLSPANPAGHYALHSHHNHGAGPNWVRNCAVVSTRPGFKAGITLHGTSRVAITDNLVLGYTGCGIFLEDGDEHLNEVRGNLIAGCDGDGTRPEQEIGSPDFGRVGAAVWAHNSSNIIEGNTFEDCEFGVVLLADKTRDLGYGAGKVRLPKALGSHEYDTVLVAVETAQSLAFHRPVRGNTFRRCKTGIEPWNLTQSDPPILIAEGNVFEACDLPIHTAFIHGAEFRGNQFGTPAAPCVEGVRMHSPFRAQKPAAYNHLLRVRGGGFRVTERAIVGSFAKGIDAEAVAFDADIEAVVLHHFPHRFDRNYLFRGCSFRSPTWLRTYPADWATGNPDPHAFCGPARCAFIDCNGQSFEVWFDEQAWDYVPPASSGSFLGSPIPGATNAEIHAEWGFCAFGYMAPADLAAHPGVKGALTHPDVRDYHGYSITTPFAKRAVRAGTAVTFALDFTVPAQVLAVCVPSPAGWSYHRPPPHEPGAKVGFAFPDLPPGTYALMCRSAAGELHLEFQGARA